MAEYKCQTCCHSSVCALRKNYEQFINEIREKEKLLEFKDFRAIPICDHHAVHKINIKDLENRSEQNAR